MERDPVPETCMRCEGFPLQEKTTKPQFDAADPAKDAEMDPLLG